MNKIVVSIVIPTYNRANCILKSISSVLDQTIRDIELIVIDDCSSDNTKQILSNIKDPRFKFIILDKNMGACHARNIGISIARGNYIAFQDSDDYWKPNKLEKQLQVIDNNKADIVFCKVNRYLVENIDFSVVPSNYQEGFVTRNELISKGCISTVTLFGKRECFQKEKFEIDMPCFQDYEIAIRLSLSFTIYFLNESLVDVYLQSNSITMNANHKETLIKIYEKYYNSVEKSIQINWLKTIIKYKTLNSLNANEDCEKLYDLDSTTINCIVRIFYKIRLLKAFFILYERLLYIGVIKCNNQMQFNKKYFFKGDKK